MIDPPSRSTLNLDRLGYVLKDRVNVKDNMI